VPLENAAFGDRAAQVDQGEEGFGTDNHDEQRALFEGSALSDQVVVLADPSIGIAGRLRSRGARTTPSGKQTPAPSRAAPPPVPAIPDTPVVACSSRQQIPRPPVAGVQTVITGASEQPVGTP
jgi:hypothetical protein